MRNDEVSMGRRTHALHRSCFILFRFLLTWSFCIAGIACRQAAEPPPRETTNADSPVQHSAFSIQHSSSNPPSLIPNPSTWPLFRGDAQATGVAHGGLPEKLELLWTFSTAKGGFESTAAIVNGTVYIGSTDGNLYALDLQSGKKRWEFATPLGFSASPAVRDGRIYIGDADGLFYCVDAATGKKLWDFSTDGEIDSSANFHGQHVLFGSQDANLYCLDALSGKLVWRYQCEDQIRCFPTVTENLGFVAGCDGHLHIVDLGQGRGVAKVKIVAPTGSSAAVMDGRVFVGTEGHTFFAIDPRKAEIVWQYENPKHGAAFRSSATVTPQAIIVGSRDKQLHALNPKSGQQLWEFATKGRVDSSPVVVGDRVFVGSADGRLYALDVQTGKPLWQFEAGGAIIASPAVADGRLLIGNDSGNLYCFGAKK